MQFKDIIIGSVIRYRDNGNLYKVKDKYIDEVGAGCHSFDMEFIKIQSIDNEHNILSVHPSELVNSEIPKDELKKYISISYLKDSISKLKEKYNRLTTDTIREIIVKDNYFIVKGDKIGEEKIYF